MKQIPLLLVALLCSISAHAAWDTTAKQDPMTDKKIVFAGVTSTDKQSRFWLYRGDQGQIIGAFKSAAAFEQIHYQHKMINVRVDKNTTRSIPLSDWEPKLVYFNIDDNSGFLEELMDGSTLLLEYFSSATQTKVKQFRLTASTKAIMAALPDYERLEIREKRKAEDEAKQAAMLQQEWRKNSAGDIRERARKECPDELEQIERIETKSGRPQMFRGCSNW